MDKTPIIRLELERMKHSVIHALVAYNDDLEKVVNGEIDKAIKDFNLEKYIREQVDSCVKGVVNQALYNQIGWKLSDEITKAVEKMLAEKLTTPNEGLR